MYIQCFKALNGGTKHHALVQTMLAETRSRNNVYTKLHIFQQIHTVGSSHGSHILSPMSLGAVLVAPIIQRVMTLLGRVSPLFHKDTILGHALDEAASAQLTSHATGSGEGQPRGIVDRYVIHL